MIFSIERKDARNQSGFCIYINKLNDANKYAIQRIFFSAAAADTVIVVVVSKYKFIKLFWKNCQWKCACVCERDGERQGERNEIIL